MAKNDTLAMRIKGLRLGEYFVVDSESERQCALKTAAVLKSAKMIRFTLTTRRNGDGPGWKVVAI